MPRITTFWCFYDVENENTANKVYSTCPSSAAKEFHKDAFYQLSDAIHVRNMEGRLFKYTLDQLK